MYESFYGLHKAPFDLTPDPKLLVMTGTHSEALSNLEYGISRHKGIILLTGVAGSGKTTVIGATLERQSQRVKSVYLNNPTLTRDEFLELLAERFDLSPGAARSKVTLLRELDALVRRRKSLGDATVLVVDEAQALSLELLEEIRLLANIEKPDEKLLCIVLAGQPALAQRLDDPGLSQLKQRIELRCELRPLTAEETAGYLILRIERAGGVAAELFTRDAVEAIHQESTGIPRTISVLADNALLSAFAMGHRQVVRQTVLDVSRELRLRPTPDARRVIVSAAVAVPVDASADPGAEPLARGNGHGAEVVTSAEGDGADRMFQSLPARRRRLSLFG